MRQRFLLDCTLRDGGITLEEICREPMLLREKGSGSKKCISSYFERVGVDVPAAGIMNIELLKTISSTLVSTVVFCLLLVQIIII